MVVIYSGVYGVIVDGVVCVWMLVWWETRALGVGLAAWALGGDGLSVEGLVKFGCVGRVWWLI